MNEWKRRWRRQHQALALGLLLGVLATPLGIAHLDLRPDVCEGPGGPATTDGVRLEARSSFHLHDHCFTCHWLQSFRSTLLASGTVALASEGVSPVEADESVTVEIGRQSSVPARAPPATGGLADRG